MEPTFLIPSNDASSSKQPSTKTTCFGSCNSADIIETNAAKLLPENILIEILSRLPVESLWRFKRVCKRWLSLIKEDSHFIDLHCKRSKSRPNLLYINPLPDKGVYFRGRLNAGFNESKSLQQSISCAEMVEGSAGEKQVEAIISHVRVTDHNWFLYDQVLEPVNGLVCFVDWKTHGIRIYNAGTQEAAPWVKSTLLAEENDANKDSTVEIKALHKHAIYRFGFDPEKKEHKVFSFWRLVARHPRHIGSTMDRPDYENWEALTVGKDTKWRRINAVPNEHNQIKIKQVHPPVNCLKRQVYADGTIYWSNKEYYQVTFGDSNPDDPDVIVAFDVGSEKYRVIPIPNFILNEPRDVRLPISMLVLGGHVALLYQMEPYVVKMWMLDDGVNKKLDNCRGNNSDWSTETITLPFNYNRIGVFGIAGSTDKILFESWESKKDLSYTSCLHVYDRKKKTFKMIEMDGDSSFTHHSQRSLVTTFTGSLFPVTTSQQVKS